MPTRKCFLCGGEFQSGPRAHLGRQVKAWDIAVCDECYASQRGGIVPHVHPRLVEHLKARGIEPEYDAHGWIRWPLPD